PGVVCAALAQLEPASELRVDRVGEPVDLSWDQGPGQGGRGQLRDMEDLVRPRAADPRDHALVAEQRVQAPGLPREDLAQLSRVDLVRLRPEVAELELDGVGGEEPDSGALLLP